MTIISPLVSVIVPIYNAEKYLFYCLDSIKTQDFSDFEVIMVDDGSTDDSSSICNKFVCDDKRFKLYTQDNMGVSTARNLALAHSQGKYILFVDSDDIINSDYISKMISCVEVYHNTHMAVCCFNEFNNNIYDGCSYHLSLKQGLYSSKKYIVKTSSFAGSHYVGVLWNKIYLARIIKCHNINFNEDLHIGEDFVFNMNYLKYSQNIFCTNLCLYNYRKNVENSLCSINNIELDNISERIIMYNSYKSLYKAKGLSSILRPLMINYIIKIYFDRLDILGENANKFKKDLYNKCIANQNILRLEFATYYLIKKLKRTINNRGKV